MNTHRLTTQMSAHSHAHDSTSTHTQRRSQADSEAEAEAEAEANTDSDRGTRFPARTRARMLTHTPALRHACARTTHESARTHANGHA